ncbi:ABC transporter permease [Anaerolineae bacterium CFX9]|jgi:ribose/xylose/arabinose/galactoside ABC-type transport system permease subunit|uniref:ABC transporter permease n=1 Tax=Geitlerinema calcuttense NRMC-F 0142 TaxID=2922238 RepID=A0ABT7LW18_9CYAN|nr:MULTISPECIES: ABC transporter permease [Cyanophyceae]MDL1900987.1 ABC transporter permease [Anaerolineae bacterium CFX9]MDL5055306.1 ABC transporter permease [Oscillatoria laete-virens NRMC-F 0139]MDL5056211.1 ABC transporter permease [Geitlerinema calcuttense NRMC-F 0142]
MSLGFLNAGRVRSITGSRDSLTIVSLFISLLVLCLFFGSQTPFFFTQANLETLTRTIAVVGITSIGMTLVLISGGVDISVGSVAALAGVVTSQLWLNSGIPLGVSAVIGVLSGGLVGLFNGIIVSYFRINPLITTLATFSIVRGLAFVLSEGQTNLLSNEAFNFLGRGTIAGIPFSLIIMLLLYAIFALVLRYTAFGRNLYAIGGSAEASRLAGISVTPHLLIVFIISGLLAAFSGIISVSQLASSAPRAATGLEFTVITAVVLGGTSLAGGKGTLIGTLIGVIILRVLDNGLVLMSVSSFYQEVARGVVLILAVSFDQVRIRIAQLQQRRRKA